MSLTDEELARLEALLSNGEKRWDLCPKCWKPATEPAQEEP